MISIVKSTGGRHPHFKDKVICRCLQTYVDYEHDDDGEVTSEIEDEAEEGKLYLCVARYFDEKYYERVDIHILSESDTVIQKDYQYCMETGEVGFGSVFKNSRNIIATTDDTLPDSIRSLTKTEIAKLCENYNI